MLVFCGTTLLGFAGSPGDAEHSVDTVFHAICLRRPLPLCSLADLGGGIPEVSLITG